jgi:hypothetical protein
MRFKLSLLKTVCLLVTLDSVFTGAFAQADRATINGAVRDAVGAVVPGAKVVVNSSATGLMRETVTTESGLYVLPSLPVGVYKLTISQQGFAVSVIEQVTLRTGDTRTIDVTLQVGGVDSTVEIVAADALPVDRSSFTVGTVIKNEQVQNLPINGRHWASLMTLAPGAVNTGSGSQNSVRFNGRGRDENNFTLDGIDQTGIKDPRQEENLRLVISTEAVAEFRINTAIYSADQGAGAGAQVNLVSRSGTNEFHGSLFHFLRNDVFDARAFNDFDNPAERDGGVQDPFRLNQFGGRIGGPAIKDRSFFFLSYEGLRQRRGVTFTNLVPSAAFRAQVAASPNAAVLKPVLDLYPLGTTSVNATTDSLIQQNKNRLDEDSVNFRFDHRLNQNHLLFFRTNVDTASARLYNREDSLNTRSFEFQPANHVIQYQGVFSQKFINETRFGINRSPLDRVDGNGVLVEGPRIDGFTRLRPTVTQIEKGTSYSLVNNSNWVLGRHTLRFGMEARRIHVNVAEGTILELRFRNATDFLNNRVDNFDLNGELPTLGERRWYLMPYVQDDFRVSQNLTLNLGVRYDYYTVGQEVKGRGRVFDLACGGYCPAGTPWYAPDRNNVSPRIGFAWQPAGFGGKTSVRGGFGIFYGPGQNDDINAAIDNARDRFTLTRAQQSNLSYPVTPFVGAGRPAVPSPRGLDRNRRDFYSQNWTLSLVQELPLNLTGVIGYVGSSAHKLFNRTNLNVIDPVTKQRPLPGFGEVDSKENRGNSSFHALQFSLYRRIGRGLSLGTEYMWSHAISDFPGSGESEQPQDVFNLRGERTSTDFDIRHTFTTNYIYELPFGAGKKWLSDGVGATLFGNWQLSGITVARTGRPVNITISRSASALPDQNSRSIQRPNIASGANVEGVRDGNRGFINAAAFTLPASGVYGNAPRNAARGASLIQFDLSLAKNIPVREGHKLDFRVDVFNLFNRPQYGQPDGFLGTVTYNSAGVAQLAANPLFGTSVLPVSLDIGTGTNRSLQLSLRYSF